MVKIKYNNSKMNKKTTTTFVQNRKRTLRSANKSTNQDNVVTGSSSEQKVIQDIHKIFDNQQSINLSKSTDPFHQDLKTPLIPTYHNQLSPRNIKATLRVKTKNQHIDCNFTVLKQQQNGEYHSVSVFNTVIETKQKVLQQQQEIFKTPVKAQSLISQNELSQQFKQQRRSYRKLKGSKLTQVPYRKFQDPFQQKIVILINRIMHRKSTQKDILNFTDKISKISSKDIYNPYIVSGIKTIVNIIEKSQTLPVECIKKLKAQLKNLSTKIMMELEKTEDYNNVHIEKKEANYDEFKPKFIKKIYKFLLQTNQYAFNEAKQKSMFICDQFFSQSNNFTKEEDLLSFFKNQKFLQA